MSRHRNMGKMLDDYYEDEDAEDFGDYDDDDAEEVAPPVQKAPPPKKPAITLKSLKAPAASSSNVAAPVKDSAAASVAGKLTLKSLQLSNAPKAPVLKVNLSSLKSKIQANTAAVSSVPVAVATPVKQAAVLVEVPSAATKSLPSDMEWQPAPYAPKLSDARPPSEFAAALATTHPREPVDVFSLLDSKKFKFDTPSPEDVVNDKRSTTKLGLASSMGSLKISPASSKDSLEVVADVKPSVERKGVDLKKLAQSSKPNLNIVIIGHVDSGKSTLTGHLLHQAGNLTSKQMHRFKTDSAKIGKDSFMYAWAMDSTEDERSRGVTISTGMDFFETEKRRVVILDAPGHKDFVANMITGAVQADACILVVDSSLGEFEKGLSGGGQTKEHAILVRSLGVSQCIVAVNKMDTMNWSKDRYDEVKSQLDQFLSGLGYNVLEYVPCSGYQGINLTQVQKDSWYQGKSILSCLDQVQLPERDVEGDLRMSVNDFSGGIVSAQINRGSIYAGDKVTLMPFKYDCIVKSVLDERGYALAGDNCSLKLSLDESMISIGTVLCSKSLIRTCTHFRSKLIVFDCSRPILNGSSVVFHFGCINIPAYVVKLVELLDKTTGGTLKKNPRTVGRNTCAIVDIQLDSRTCLETYKDDKEFSRFMLRNNGESIAAGIVLELLD